VRTIPNDAFIHESVLESGAEVHFPKHYSVEEWMPYTPAVAAPAAMEMAMSPMGAVVEKIAAVAGAPSAKRLTRR
jgi:hypothetical protein